MRGNGGIIGPANIPSNSIASGEWSLREQLNYTSNWPSSIPAFAYVGVTTGHVDDTGSLAVISFPSGTSVGDIAIVRVNVDDSSTTIKSSISGWTTIISNGDQGAFAKVLDSSDISSPPSLLNSIDSNSWICYVIRGGYSLNSIGSLQSYGPVSFTQASNLVESLSTETSDDVIIFAGAGGKREITSTILTGTSAGSYTQWTQSNFPGTTGLAVSEFAFIRLTGGNYSNVTCYMTNTNINNFTEVAFYLKV